MLLSRIALLQILEKKGTTGIWGVEKRYLYVTWGD